MSFLIEYIIDANVDVMSKDKNAVQLNPRCVLFTKDDMAGKKTLEISTSDGSIIYFGDLISAPFKGGASEFLSWLNSAKGNFNGVYYTKESAFIFSSIFSVLPLFYVLDDKKICVSDQIVSLTPFIKDNVVDDFHFLERILFNYSLTNRTCVSGINQMPVNSFLKLEKGKYEFYKHTEISNLFQSSPIPLKKSLKDLVDIFNFQLEEYLPDRLFNVAFTSGFDGRSIVSSCVKNKKKFVAYSFGTMESDDVNIPFKISGKMGIDFQPVLTDDHYLNEIYFESAKRMVTESNGLATIGRAHYVFGSEILSKRSDVMVSGNSGSELLRASHLDGVLTTRVFFHWLKEGLPFTLSEFLALFPEFSFLNHERFSRVYEKLITELETKRKKNHNLPLNARLYYLLWEESLRNYFGGELSMQQKYLAHRSPFMDYTFFKEIQKTGASGAYFNYRDKNLVRRMPGQFFYAHLLRKNNQDLFRFPTGRGYSPEDVLSINGKIKLIYSKIIKKKQVSDKDIDPSFSTKGYLTHYNEFLNGLADKLEGYFDLGQNIDEMSMKTLFSFSILFEYLDAERILLSENIKSKL